MAINDLSWSRQLKSTNTNLPAGPDASADIIAYHERTKHHPERYARGPHGFDWATQPNPFRRFANAPLFHLPLTGRDETPAAASLFGAVPVTPRPLTLEALSLFFELSLGVFRAQADRRFELVSADEPVQRQPASHGSLCGVARAR